MKKVFAKSVYAMEPQSLTGTSCWNDGHWNYQWSGRNSKMMNNEIRFRKEAEGFYLVQDTNGIVWMMDEAEFRSFQENRNHAVA